MNRLAGKVAIVTGGSLGIGQAAAILFAKEGAKVVVAARGSEAGEKTVKMIKEAGGEAIFIKTDISKTEDVENMIKTTVDTYGKLDVIFNNAGIAPYNLLVNSTEEEFERLIAIDLKGVWLGMKCAIPEMIKAGGGSIINVSSYCADMAERGSSVYAATKGGITSMSKVVAVEHGPDNIRVNVIKPGQIATRLLMDQASNEPGILERIEQETPLGRLGKPEDVAQLALFLASDESSFITGEAIVIDGGIQAYSHIA
jgi:NAD(P)-dependent dehydrogenase (short-subunit alcohol dehydrogenase family)